jgi:hypothetical protein
MNPNKLNLETGQKFGMLTYLSEAGRKYLPSGQWNRMVLVRCECGNEKEVRVMHLVRQRIKSCGCMVPDHGMSKTKLYRVWTGMINRCTSDKCIDHHRYKDRGISMSDIWKSSFVAFKDWATSNGYKQGLQIDRIDNNKGYCPDNCRFVTPSENVRNREVTFTVQYNGQDVPLVTILEQKGIRDKYYQILARIKRGWDHQMAIDTPMRKGNYKRKNAVQAN